MQPLAIIAIAIGAVMLAGVTAALIWIQRHRKALPAGMNRWQLVSIPLAAGGAVLGLASHGSGQSPATRDIAFAVAMALLLSALSCAVAGAAIATRTEDPAVQ